ncbi:methylmalonate-semialdehyde dehydrogenase (CoA acylating), partial [Aeromonas salmonicida]|uniref:aldehyde dehydrogenase family protein n=1 Tax=Aeromonas salmonicida TaxID=645 RepID=UPI00111A91FD
MTTLGNFIDGRHGASHGGRSAPIHNPATGEEIGRVALSSAAECAEAIAVAERAFPAWAQTPPLVRARVMFRFKALMEEHRDELAALITREHGKVLSDAQGELTRGLEVVEFALKGEHSLNVGRGVDSHSMMQPVGVCAGIT